ncbi:unnamed protein product [Sphagnum jensenii]|uniref:Uncharacterized protein n=1 Tax=Sphagnum jensenii TaxID=128206 RepID=A0ABP1AAM8_9BRYO
MRREGRVCGKPTNRTRATGKCRRVGCLGCHAHPVNKSLVKAKGHVKRTAWDITRNHHLDNWRLCTNITYDAAADVNARSSGIWGGSESGDVEVKVFEYPTPEDYHHEEQEEVYEEEHESAAEESGIEDPELEDVNDAPPAAVAGSDDDDGVEEEENEEEIEAEFPDFQAQFRRGSEMFKSEIEAACKQADLPVSEDSWSGIELSDDDRSQTSSWDDWSIVDEEEQV